jgi:hypothetical protein
MSDLSITATDVAPVKVIEQFTAPAHEAIDAGEAVYFVAATGKVGLADENGSAPLNEPEGIAITTANQANITVTVVKQGIIDVGDALAGLDYGATVYLSQTAGLLADADPANGVVIGEVVPAFGATTADKLLRIDL